MRIDVRWAEGKADRISAYAAELIGIAPDVLFASGPAVVSELRKRTRTIPIVFVRVPDPVVLGLVVSLARPGGNVTGFTHFELAMGEKWLEALKEISPRVRRVALLQNPDHPAWPGFLRTIKAAAPSFGVEVFPAGIHEAGDIVGTIEAFAREADGGLIVLPSPPATMHRDLIVTLAARHRLPAIYPLRYYRRRFNFLRAKYGRPVSARGYIDRILKCEKAADLPVQIQGCKS